MGCRRATAPVLAVLVALLAAACEPAPGGEPAPEGDPPAPSYGEELGTADEDGGGGERVTLPDGGELAVYAEDSDTYVAQWRDPDGEGWTETETVAEGDDMDAAGVTLETDGDTVAAAFDWWAEGDDERETFARSDAAICRDLTCDAVVEGIGSAPMLAEDGDYVVAGLPQDEDAEVAQPWELTTWSAGDTEWGRMTVDGPTLEMDDYLRPALVLLEDGALATVLDSSGEEEQGCRVELWAGDPRGGELEAVAATDPVPGGGCSPELVGTPDGESVEFYLRGIDDVVTFSRAEGSDSTGWEDDLPDSGSALLDIDGDEGRTGISMTLEAVEGLGSVAVGSPDGRRIVAQHRDDSGEWSRPVTVARAAPGQRCRRVEASTLYERSDVVYVVNCWARGSAYGDEYSDTPPPATGFAVATSDGRTWVAEPLDSPAYSPDSQVSTRVLLARGGERSLVWRTDAEQFETIDLPLPNPTVDGLAMIGRDVIRVLGNPDDDRQCRPTWDVAPLGATAWSYGGRIGPIRDYARTPGACYGVALDEQESGRTDRAGRLVRVAGVIDSVNSSVDGQLVRRGETWRFRPYAD